MNNPQSWYDLPLMQAMDPRSIVSFVQLDDNTGLPQTATFLNSPSFLNNTTWVGSPLTLSAVGPTSTPICFPVAGVADFEGIFLAQQWTSSHGIVRSNVQLPPTVQKIIFLKAGNRFLTTFFLDWAAGVTSTDIQLSIRDNSTTGGNFINGANGTIPVFAWTNTFGGTKRKLTVCTTGPGRVNRAMRVIDNAANWSMFEMDWNIVN
jgi:hypothetical protein